MTDDNSSNLSEKLNKTREKLNLLSKKVAETTKSMVESTNNSIKSTISDHKEKRQKKREEKIEKAKSELSEDGLLDDVPSMITLPEFEQERMEIAAEQNDTMINIVEEMQRLSERIDSLEKRIRIVSASQNQLSTGEKEKTDLDSNATVVSTSPVMSEVIHLLGASLLWIVALFGIDKLISDRELLIMNSYPAEIPIWAIGAATWSLYLLHRLGKSSNALKLPKLLTFQTSAAVGITTALGLMVYDETMTTISNVWIWGTIVAIGLLLASSMIASVWSSTKKLVGISNEVEIID